MTKEEKEALKQEQKREKNQAYISRLVDKGAIKITAKNKNLLSPRQLKRYEEAKEEQNIVYLKGKKLLEFDSETAKQIKVGKLKAGGARMRGGEDAVKELRQRIRSEANLHKRDPKGPSDSSPSGKAYSTELGISLPRRRPSPPATAEQMRRMENKDYRKGGMVISTVDNRRNKG